MVGSWCSLLVLDSKQLVPIVFTYRLNFDSIVHSASHFVAKLEIFSHRSFTRVTRGPEIGAYYHPLFQKDNLRLCMQMSCIHSNEAQVIQSMNPVALGLAAPPPGPSFGQVGMMTMAPNLNNFYNPAQMALLHDGQNQLYLQQQQLNQHSLMAMAEMHNQAVSAQQQQQQQGGGTSAIASTSGPSACTQNLLNQQQPNHHATSIAMATAEHNQAGQPQQQQQQMVTLQLQQQQGTTSERASSSGPSRTSTEVSSSTEAIAALNQDNPTPAPADALSVFQMQQVAAAVELNSTPTNGGAAARKESHDGGWYP
jgi:hypothetical protein